MKIKQLFKKAFTMVELVIVIAVVAVLAATSVGIYFGVMNSKPDEQSISIQEQVITLWEGYISDSTKYYDDIENKAFEFCTEYASKKGINVELNYRVLEFDDFVSSIVEANGIQRAYDPSGNAKEAVIIKIDTTYPSFFISTAYSVLKVNLPRPTEEMLIADIVKDPFVIESGLLTRYRIDENSKPESFNSFYELSDINVNGEIKRGIRYVRYLVNHADNNSEEVYKPEYIVYGRANRTLNEECEGRYLPDYFSVEVGDMSLSVTTYDLIEKRNDLEYYYDPDHYYTYFNESFTHDESLTNVEVYDKDTEEFVTKECPLSTFNSQYVVGEQKISYDPYINIDGMGNGGSANNPDQDIDINTPITELPPRPDEDDIDPEDIIKMYPIILYFTEEIHINIEKMPGITKVLKWLNIKQTHFQFLYFESFDTLEVLISANNFYELLTGVADKNVYIYVCDGAVLDTVLTLKDTGPSTGFTFIVYHRPEIEYGNNITLDNLYDITGKKGILSKKPDITLDVNYMNEKNYSSTQAEPYKVTWPKEPTKTIRIAQNGHLIVGTNSRLFIESNCYPTSNNGWKLVTEAQDLKPWGYKISEYAEVINDGEIILTSNAKARITGIIRSEARDPETGEYVGKIIANETSVISEPFRITDYLGHEPSNKAFIKRNIFPTEFYYLDSIRCALTITDSARYVGLITIRDYRQAASASITWIGYINLVSSVKYNDDSSKKEYGTIFKLTGSNSEFKKTYDETNNRSNFEVVSGNLNYSYAWVDILKSYSSTPLSTDDDGDNPAFKLFSTKYTGFKLSNINLIVNENTSFTMPGEAYNGGNTGYPELEILPTSSLQIKEGGKFFMGQNTYLYVNNYFVDDSACNEFVSKINSIDLGYDGCVINGKRNDILSDRLIENQVKLAEMYSSNNIPMLNVEGTINIDQNYTFDEDTDYQYTTCHHSCIACWLCTDSYTSSAEVHKKYIRSAIYSWGLAKINGAKSTASNYLKSTSLTPGVEYHKHSVSCRHNSDKTYPIYIFEYNDVAFAYPGDNPCYAYPKFTISF